MFDRNLISPQALLWQQSDMTAPEEHPANYLLSFALCFCTINHGKVEIHAPYGTRNPHEKQIQKTFYMGIKDI